MIRFLRASAVTVVFVSMGAVPLHAATIAWFDGGNDNTVVDAYPGVAGLGWATAWQTQLSGASFSTGPTVVASTPLSPGGGNYLTAAVSASASGGQGAIGRQYGAATGDVVASQPHTIHFQYRPEDLTGFTDGEDRFQAFARATLRHGTDADTDWMILGQGGNFGSAQVAGKWVVYDGLKDSGGFVDSRMVNTGIQVVAGTTYDMWITVHPQEREYDVTISDGVNTYSAKNFGFRRNAPAGSPGTMLHFGGRGSAAGDVRPFSVDAVEIAQYVAPAIEAHFSKGTTGTTFVDQYGGTAGRGWAAAWTPSGTLTATITAANPLRGPGDPYLAVTSTASGAHTVRRSYTQYGAVDPAQPHRIQWTWRFDGDLDSLNSFDDRIHFFGDSTAMGSTTGTNSWTIGWVAADRPGNDVFEGKWYFFNRGANGDFNLNNMVNTGMDLVPGRVYEFEVWVYPALGKYDATISDGQTTFGAQGLNFRNGQTGQFNWLHFGTTASASGDNLNYSLDGVVISQVPEPASRALAAAALVGLALAARRRARARSREQVHSVPIPEVPSPSGRGLG